MSNFMNGYTIPLLIDYKQRNRDTHATYSWKTTCSFCYQKDFHHKILLNWWLFLRNGWTTKGVKPYFQPGPLSNFSPSQISNKPWAGFKLAQNLSPGFLEWSCAAVITNTPRRHINPFCINFSLYFNTLWSF